MTYTTLAQQALEQQYAHPETARSMLVTANPKTGEIDTAVQMVIGRSVKSIEETVEQLVSRGIAEKTEDPQVIRLKSTGGK
ncbi:MAG: hypothetical protein HY438_04280 [DPANN group archaeon]|nr:hypothetical protein [DPANN group archaeon]